MNTTLTSIHNDVQWNCLKVLRLNLNHYTPKWLRCCRNRRFELEYNVTYQQLLDELSITRIVRQLRYLNAFAKKSMSEADWEVHRLSTGYSAFNT